MTGTESCTLYRLYSIDGALLYIGIAGSWPRRMAEHARQQPWWRDVADLKLEVHPTRAAAETAERDAIRAEKPAHNVTHNGAGQPTSRRDQPDVSLAAGLVGHFFLTPHPDGYPRAHRQGHVVALIGDATYLVELFSWFDGSPHGRELVTLHTMAGWTFYPGHEEFLEHANRAMAAQRNATR